jgi:hypothetical protein
LLLAPAGEDVRHPNIRERTATNTATGYFADDSSDSDFFIEGTVQLMSGERVLSFIVLAVRPGPNGTTIRGAVRGSELFAAMWAHFVAMGTVIDLIQAEWTTSPLLGNLPFTTNLDAFNAAVLVHPTLEDAALHGTPTGSYARRVGHTRVLVVRTRQHAPHDPYYDVQVEFRRS